MALIIIGIVVFIIGMLFNREAFTINDFSVESLSGWQVYFLPYWVFWQPALSRSIPVMLALKNYLERYRTMCFPVGFIL